MLQWRSISLKCLLNSSGLLYQYSAAPEFCASPSQEWAADHNVQLQRSENLASRATFRWEEDPQARSILQVEALRQCIGSDC